MRDLTPGELERYNKSLDKLFKPIRGKMNKQDLIDKWEKEYNKISLEIIGMVKEANKRLIYVETIPSYTLLKELRETIKKFLNDLKQLKE